MKHITNKMRAIAESIRGVVDYVGGYKMGKGRSMTAPGADVDYTEYSKIFHTDSHVFGIITTIADSMSEAGVIYPGKTVQTQEILKENVIRYDIDSHIARTTLSAMVWGNDFVVLTDQNKQLDFLEHLSPIHMKPEKGPAGRFDHWKYTGGNTQIELKADDVLHIPINNLANYTWGISPLQPLRRILQLKEETETNLYYLVKKYLVPRYVYLLGSKGTKVPQEVIDTFAKSLANPGATEDQVFENNLEILTLGTQYKALHVGYILEYVINSVYSGLAFPDSFMNAKGSTEATSKIQMEIFNKKRIGGLQRAFRNPYAVIMSKIVEIEGQELSNYPIPSWGPLSSASLEAKIAHIIELAKTGSILSQQELRNILANELGFDIDATKKVKEVE